MSWVLGVVGLIVFLFVVFALRKPRSKPDPVPEAVLNPAAAVPPSNEAPGWLRQAPVMEEAVPSLEKLGPYKIEATLGQGAMATVYKAFDSTEQRWVALKVANSDSETTQRFQREIEISRQLLHPNLVEVYFGGVLEGSLCMAMEWIEGLTLEHILASGPLPLEDFPLLACQLAAGLHFAQKLGFLHRDIKPSNIMVGRDGTLKLLDFGLALAEGQERLTVVGCTMGTPTHMSPEGLTQGASDALTDQYALGVVFYQMLTGRCPFEGSPIEVGQAHIKQAPPPMSQFRSGVRPEWEECVQRMLSKRPQDRFEDMSQIRRFLMTALVEPT